MGSNTKIEWCDHTFNPWRGCVHKQLADGSPHPGCEHCYAEAMSKRNPGTLGVWGAEGTRVLASLQQWSGVRKWNDAAAAAGRIDRVFCASLADVFEDWPGEIRDSKGRILHRCRAGHVQALDAVYAHGVECQSGCNRAAHPLALDDVRRDLFELIDATPHLFWLLLTKRPENVRDRPNIAIGTSISDQATADELVPQLLACRDLAPVLFLSVEPLVGPVDLSQIGNSTCGIRRSDGKLYPLLRYNALAGHEDPSLCQGAESHGAINWVIVGGESGHHARPMHPQWARDVRDQCTAAGVPFFFKQWGEWGAVHHPIGGAADVAINGSTHRYGEWHGRGEFVESCLCGSGHGTVVRVGKHDAGRLLDGREWSELPAALSMEAARV